MMKQAAYKGGDFVFLYRQVDQTVPGVAKVTRIEIFVARKECGTAQVLQEGDDFVILHPAPSDIEADLSHPDTPTFQYVALTFRDVLVQDVHAAIGSRMNSSACLRRA